MWFIHEEVYNMFIKIYNTILQCVHMNAGYDDVLWVLTTLGFEIINWRGSIWIMCKDEYSIPVLGYCG